MPSRLTTNAPSESNMTIIFTPLKCIFLYMLKPPALIIYSKFYAVIAISWKTTKQTKICNCKKWIKGKSIVHFIKNSAHNASCSFVWIYIHP